MWVRKKDDVYLQVEADLGILRELSDFFKFRVPGYQFMPAYRNRMWDGYIRLFNMNDGSLYLGLLPYIQKFVEARQYSIVVDKNVTNRNLAFTIEDCEKFLKTLNLDLVPRDYQIAAIHHSIVNNRALLLSPTGSGKSLIIYSLIRWYHEKTLVIVPTINLVSQMFSDFEDYAKNDSFDINKNTHCIFAGQEKNTDKQIVISTWQSIYKLPKKWFQQFGLVVGDEVHGFKATSLKTIMTNLTTTPYRIGTTGTLDGTQTHKLVLEGLFGTVFSTTTTKKLMDASLLADLDIHCIILKYPENESKLVKSLNYQDEIKYIISHKRRNRFICNLACSRSNNTMVLFEYVETHGEILFKMIEKKLKETNSKRKVFYIHGGTDKDEREEIRKRFETEKDMIVVASKKIMSTGINAPNLKTIIFVSPSKARIATLQSIGRILRIGNSKEANLIDIVDDFSYKTHRNFALKHFLERVKIYNSEKFKYKLSKLLFDK